MPVDFFIKAYFAADSALLIFCSTNGEVIIRFKKMDEKVSAYGIIAVISGYKDVFSFHGDSIKN